MVVWGQGGAEPLTLTETLMAQRHEIGRFRAGIGLSLSATPSPDHADCVTFVSYCAAGINRRLAQAGRLDILPVSYTQLARAFAPVDVLFLHLPPAEENGRYSMGLAQEYLVPLIEGARLVIAEVNDRLPRTCGDRTLDPSEIDLIVESSRAPLTLPPARTGDAEGRIARYVAGLIEDRSVLQMGLGQLPEAILKALGGHRDLGVHSGAIGDGVADLAEAGIITNAFKKRDAGVSIGGVLLGSERIYSFADRNSGLRLAATGYTHHPEILAAHDRFVAINSAIEVDLTGQVNAEVADGVYVGAVGGAGEFLRGALRSYGGLPIIALPATVARTGASRIVEKLSGPVSTARNDVGVIVTEHGVADLRGKTLRERRRLMLDIAAPDLRAQLDAGAPSFQPGIASAG